MSSKQTLLTSAAVFALAIGTALAQTDPNTSTVTQSGANDSATADQTGQTSGDAVSNINQGGGSDYANAQVSQSGSGAGNNATIYQYGTSPTVSVSQSSGATGTAQNSAFVEQTSYVNGSVSQTGDANSASLIQFQGNGATPDTPDGSISQTGSGNTAWIYQIGGAANTASIQQTGNDNGLGQSYQYGENGTISIVVNGNNNNEAVTQSSGSYNETATINQTCADCGGYNAAGISQQGEGDIARVNQNGAYNDVGINQFASSRGNIAGVTQVGFGNLAVIEQNNGAIAKNGAIIDQTGVDNAASGLTYGGVNSGIVQAGNAEVATITEGGVENGGGFVLDGTPYYTSIGQYGNNDTANIGEFGNLNNSTVLQNSNDGGVGHDNSATSIQGDGPSAPLLRTNNSFSLIMQDGSFNTATVEQDGNNLTSLVTQTGTLNIANVLQTVAGSVSTITQGGGSNTASVLQTIMGGVSTITQTGTGNIATVKQ